LRRAIKITNLDKRMKIEKTKRKNAGDDVVLKK
jgi:hypothetical protein